VIARVQLSVFGAVGDAGCFTMHTGRSTARVFVVDPSYTNYQVVQCDDEVQRDGQGYRLTVTQSWDDPPPPDGVGPVAWLQRLFYRPAYHTWTYIVRKDGTVLALPERGKVTPQSYYH
jgi:hypothetical protein